MAQQDQNVIVLVADDEPSTLALVASHVRSRGYTVLEASDGDQAWQLAHEHLPDLVILDVMMPGMSGWEVCRKIREAVSLAHTGVIMLTGIGENLNEMTSPLYGADTYLDKPFEFTTLDEKVVQTLAERKQGAMGRPDPEIAAARESSRPPPPPKSNGLVLTKARTEPKAKKPAKAKDAAPREAARPLVKAKRREGAPAAAKPAKKSVVKAKPKAAKAKAKATPTKANAKSNKTIAKKAAGKKAPKKAAKAAPKKAAKAAPKKAAKAAPKKAAKAAPKKAAPKKAAKPAAGRAKTAAKKAAVAKAPPAKRAAPKMAAPKAVKAAATPAAPAAKKRKALVASPPGDATV